MVQMINGSNGKPENALILHNPHTAHVYTRICVNLYKCFSNDASHFLYYVDGAGPLVVLRHEAIIHLPACKFALTLSIYKFQ